MIIGIGIDLVKIARFKELLLRKGDRFINRIYHKNEIKNRPINKEKEIQYFASRWAIKEATWKALKYRVDSRNIQLTNHEITKEPILKLEKDAIERAKTIGNSDEIHVHCSLSHEDEYVTAIVILEK